MQLNLDAVNGAPECRVLWYFLSQKVQDITTIRKTLENRLKVNSAIKSLFIFPSRVYKCAKKSLAKKALIKKCPKEWGTRTVEVCMF